MRAICPLQSHMSCIGFQSITLIKHPKNNSNQHWAVDFKILKEIK